MMELRERKKKNCSPPMMKQREKKKRKCSPATQDDGLRMPIPPNKTKMRIPPGKTKITEITGNKNRNKFSRDDEVEPDEKANKAYIEGFRKQYMPDIFGFGFVFSPSEVQLLYSLLKKNQGHNIIFCPIVEVDSPFALHPKDLFLHLDATEKYGGKYGGYFFTTSRPNEIQSNGDIVAQGQWTSTEMNNVLDQNQQVGVKKVYEYYERDGKGKYKVIEYQLDPVPVTLKTCPWFLCKLVYIDDASCGCAA